MAPDDMGNEDMSCSETSSSVSDGGFSITDEDFARLANWQRRQEQQAKEALFTPAQAMAGVPMMPPISVTVRPVINGFIVSTLMEGERIATTLSEALDIVAEALR